MAGERFCTKCGTKARIGASFCAKCGAWVGEEMPEPLGATPPAPQLPEVVSQAPEIITREYANWKARDADVRNMRLHGFASAGQAQLSGGDWRVHFRKLNALGQMTPPPQVTPTKSMPPILLTALIIFGIAVLYGAVSVLADSPGGAASGSSPATKPSTSAARTVDPRLLASNPSSYKGSNILIQGQALNVEQHSDYTWVQVLARIPGKDYDTESIVVELRPASTTLLKGECYAFYTVGAGTQKVKRTLTGATNDVPLLNGYQYSASTADKYGTCQAPTP